MPYSHISSFQSAHREAVAILCGVSSTAIHRAELLDRRSAEIQAAPEENEEFLSDGVIAGIVTDFTEMANETIPLAYRADQCAEILEANAYEAVAEIDLSSIMNRETTRRKLTGLWQFSEMLSAVLDTLNALRESFVLGIKKGSTLEAIQNVLVLIDGHLISCLNRCWFSIQDFVQGVEARLKVSELE